MAPIMRWSPRCRSKQFGGHCGDRVRRVWRAQRDAPHPTLAHSHAGLPFLNAAASTVASFPSAAASTLSLSTRSSSSSTAASWERSRRACARTRALCWQRLEKGLARWEGKGRGSESGSESGSAGEGGEAERDGKRVSGSPDSRGLSVAA
eukprot:2512722-Pleurochrysis_carterae.AAC.2